MRVRAWTRGAWRGAGAAGGGQCHGSAVTAVRPLTENATHARCDSRRSLSTLHADSAQRRERDLPPYSDDF